MSRQDRSLFPSDFAIHHLALYCLTTKHCTVPPLSALLPGSLLPRLLNPGCRYPFGAGLLVSDADRQNFVCQLEFCQFGLKILGSRNPRVITQCESGEVGTCGITCTHVFFWSPMDWLSYNVLRLNYYMFRKLWNLHITVLSTYVQGMVPMLCMVGCTASGE